MQKGTGTFGWNGTEFWQQFFSRKHACESVWSGGEIILTDSAGTELVTYFPEKQYQSVLISCPQIQEGETYVLTAGQTNVSIEMTSLIYGSAGGRGNGMPGDRGMKGNSEDNA